MHFQIKFKTKFNFGGELPKCEPENNEMQLESMTPTDELTSYSFGFLDLLFMIRWLPSDGSINLSPVRIVCSTQCQSNTICLLSEKQRLYASWSQNGRLSLVYLLAYTVTMEIMMKCRSQERLAFIRYASDFGTPVLLSGVDLFGSPIKRQNSRLVLCFTIKGE
jgi:hypothetical protein